MAWEKVIPSAREKRINELEAKKAAILAEYKKKMDAKKAEYAAKIRSAKRGTDSDRKHRNHLMILGFTAIMKSVKADEKGQQQKAYAQLFANLAAAATTEKAKLEYLELAKLFKV